MILFKSKWTFGTLGGAYRTLWGRPPSPEIPPCWWPCRCRSPRPPDGCCARLTCCGRRPAGWWCTARRAPAAALSCPDKKQKRTPPVKLGLWKYGERLTTDGDLHKVHCAARVWSYRCVIFALQKKAKKRRLDFEAISISRAHRQAKNTTFDRNPTYVKSLFPDRIWQK